MQFQPVVTEIQLLQPPVGVIFPSSQASFPKISLEQRNLKKHTRNDHSIATNSLAGRSRCWTGITRVNITICTTVTAN